MLREKAIIGVVWNAVQHLGRQGFQLVISIILARVLLPEHYGVIGVLSVFIAISQTVVESGLGQALIQKKDATHIDECSIFYTNILLSILMYLALCLSAPWIARFYDMPQLNILTKVLGFSLVIQSLGSIHSTLLTKRIEFKPQAMITLVGFTLSGIIGIIMAYKGFGIWSLVAQALSGNTLNTLGLWLICDWRPSFHFSFQSIRSLFGFGSKVLASSLLDVFFRNIYTIVIGKLFSPTDLGLYTRGNSLVSLPTQALLVIFRRVSFPIFSSINDDRARIKRGMRIMLIILFFLNCPIVTGLAITADTFVYVLLTEKWAQCIPYIRMLSVSLLLYPLHVINGNALLSIGRSDLFLKLEIIKKVLTIASISITYRWGIEAMILGQIVQSFFAYIINAYYTGKYFGYSYWAQMTDVLPYLLTSGLMGICVYLIGILHFDSLVFKLFCQILVGIIVYLIISYILRLEALKEIIEIVKTFLTARRKYVVVSK